MYTTAYPTYREEKPSIITRIGTCIAKAVFKCGSDFCTQTSIHGFYHIAAPRRHWIERALWVAATILAIWGAVDVSLGQLQRYNESPTVVTVEKDFRSWRFSQPAVTCCYKDRVDPAKLPAVIKQHWNIEPSDKKYDYYSRFVNAVASSDLFHLERFEEFSDMKQNVDMFRIAVDVMPEADIKTMSSEPDAYKWIPVVTEAGACYVTNSLALADVSIRALDPNDTMGLPVTCKYSSLGCYISLHVSTAADFYVHSPYDVMDFTHAPSLVELAHVRNTELSVMESRCGRSVKELQPSRRGCLYIDEPVSRKKVHSINTCRLSCRSRLAMKRCGCVPFYYFYEEGPECTPADMWCLHSYKHQLSNNNREKCSCAPQCIDCIYKEISTSDRVWSGLKPRGSVKFSVQAPRTRYTREIVFHFQDLVVSFGGAAGLFLGASFISFMEILYFLLARLFRIIIRKEEKKTTVVKVKEVQIPHEEIRIKQLTALLKNYEEYDTRTGYYY